mmetsp:Transcript_10601/g.20421  ORF Transcript_10601/g.20421 Transcript_10601/m.20421 type:complete len:204 (+) Transcript_10601:153-764(+)
MMGNVNTVKFFFFRHTEPSQRIQSVKHDTRRARGPRTVHEHTVQLVAKEFALATVKDSGKLFTGVVGMCHESNVEHAHGTGSEMDRGCVEWIVNEEVVLEKDDLQLASNGTQDTDEDGSPGFNSVGRRTCGDHTREKPVDDPSHIPMLLSEESPKHESKGTGGTAQCSHYNSTSSSEKLSFSSNGVGGTTVEGEKAEPKDDGS